MSHSNKRMGAVTGVELSAKARRALSIGLILVVGLAITCLLVLPPDKTRILTGELAGPFTLDGGFAASSPAPFEGDTSAASASSHLILLEDGHPLGPAHTPHDVIRATGGGAFGHWGGQVIFSASDNSDPNGNGRVYSYSAEMPVAPQWLSVAAVALATIAALGLLLVATEQIPVRVRRLTVGAGSLLVGLAAFEATAWVVLRAELFNSDALQRRAYVWLSNDRAAERDDPGSPADGMPGTGLIPNFAPHPFLNFALNPNATYMGEAQFDSRYLIRRRERLRPRGEVAWRALVLGGSTTFNEGVRHEDDTWVHLLEQKVRATHGANFDVINGGVGGYALLDNMLHYTLLLDELQPDVVILFTGINDVHPRLIGDIKSDFSNSRLPWAGAQTQLIEGLRRFSFLQSMKLYFLTQVKAGAIGHIYSVVQRSYPPVATWPDALRHNGPDVYRKHLEFAVSLLQSRGARVVILPQIWMPRDGDTADAYFGLGVTEHNDVNGAVARERGLPYFVALLKPGLFERADVFDNCHFNARGDVRMAEATYRFLTDSGIIR